MSTFKDTVNNALEGRHNQTARGQRKRCYKTNSLTPATEAPSRSCSFKLFAVRCVLLWPLR